MPVSARRGSMSAGCGRRSQPVALTGSGRLPRGIHLAQRAAAIARHEGHRRLAATAQQQPPSARLTAPAADVVDTIGLRLVLARDPQLVAALGQEVEMPQGGAAAHGGQLTLVRGGHVDPALRPLPPAGDGWRPAPADTSSI